MKLASCARVLSLAVGRVAIEYGWRRATAMRSLIAQINPLSASLGPRRARSEHGHGRVVGMDRTAAHHVLGYQLIERAQQPGEMAEPFGKLTSIDVDATTGMDRGLAIEQKLVAELGDGDVDEEARPRHAARDRQIGQRRLHHGLAFAARAGGLHVAHDLEAAGMYSNTSVTLAPTLRRS